MTRQEDKTLRIWYTVAVQDAANPDKYGMYWMREFNNADEAMEWMVKNKHDIGDSFITKGQVGLIATTIECRG